MEITVGTVCIWNSEKLQPPEESRRFSVHSANIVTIRNNELVRTAFYKVHWMHLPVIYLHFVSDSRKDLKTFGCGVYTSRLSCSWPWISLSLSCLLLLLLHTIPLQNLLCCVPVSLFILKRFPHLFTKRCAWEKSKTANTQTSVNRPKWQTMKTIQIILAEVKVEWNRKHFWQSSGIKSRKCIQNRYIYVISLYKRFAIESKRILNGDEEKIPVGAVSTRHW